MSRQPRSTTASSRAAVQNGEFQPGMGLVTKLLLNGLVTVLCAVMVAGTTIWSSFSFASALADLSSAADQLADAATRGADPAQLVALKDAAQASAEAAVVRTRIVVSLAVLVACVFIMTPMGIVIVGVRKGINEINASLAAIAKGDLTVVPAVTSRDEMGQMAHSLQGTIASLSDTLRQVEASARRVNEAASGVGEISSQVSSAAKETASHLQQAKDASEQAITSGEQAASAVGEMEDSMRRIASASSSSSAVTDEAVTEVGVTVGTMEQLGTSSAEIGSVISTISAIAEQTNLLALNATIEAARAGETGKGFAVVAGEVKDLASQTGQATEDVTHRIGQIQSDTQAAVSAIESIATTAGKIRESQDEITQVVDEQARAAERLNSVLGVAVRSTGDTAKLVNDTSRIAANFETNAGQMLASSGNLKSEADTLTSLVGRFRF
ncbi:MAG: methyl-accepting chemotaxis protein [Dermatophilus congolensis]|nr:methyl-accepting chemotaxis protein [Dermatophilus congolensis]